MLCSIAGELTHDPSSSGTRILVSPIFTRFVTFYVLLMAILTGQKLYLIVVLMYISLMLNEVIYLSMCLLLVSVK